MEKITFVCPTRHRPANLKKLLTSVVRTTYSKIYFKFYVDDDDLVSQQALESFKKEYHDILDISYIVGPRLHFLSEASNILARVVDEGILFFCGDDVEVASWGFDLTVNKHFAAVPDKILLVYGDDGIQREKLATHFFIHKNWVNTLGHVLPPIFTGDWVDNWVTEVSTRINRIKYDPDLLLPHNHCTAGLAPLDNVYYEKFMKDRNSNPAQIFANSKFLRDQDVDKLTDFIANFNETT